MMVLAMSLLRACHAHLLLVVALLSGISHVAGQAGKTSTPAYPTIYEAGIKEVWLLQQVENGRLFPGCSLGCWAKKEQLKPLLDIASNPRTKGTVFFPGTEDAFSRQAEALCLTLEELVGAISDNEEIAARYIRAAFHASATLYSRDFKEGMSLTTLQGLNVTLHRAHNSSTWSLKEGSSLPKPGTAIRQDLNITKADIEAGKAVVHLVDLTPRIDDAKLDAFWAEKRRAALRRAGYPEDSLNCPPKPDTAPATNSLVIGVSVAAAVLLVSLCGTLFWAHKKGHCRGLKRQLTRVFSGPNKDPAAPADVEAPITPSPKEPSDTDRSHQQQQQPSGSQLSEAATAVASLPGPIYVNAGASSSAASSSMLSSLYSSGPSISSGPLGQHTPVGPLLSGTMEGSPFAAGFAGIDSLLGPEASRAVGMAQPRSESATNSSGSSRGTVPGGTNSSSGQQQPQPQPQQQHSHNYSHSSHPSRSGCNSFPEGSAGREGGDMLSPLPNVATFALAGTPTDEEAHEAAVSYEGGLLPTESVPIGQIPHALVVPYAELTLDEMIGTGAEGKVYRGTWKHTDIAAKEYLCGPGGPASEAATASAQAALAKEVYWLTRLNHPNLVRFCAVCLERPLVVMEYYKNGSVFNIIRKAEQQVAGTAPTGFLQQNCCAYLNWDRRLMMLHDVAAGMSYLHGRNHIHGDLRSPNLFVGSDGKVKIGDFGFTKRLGLNKASLRVARITHPRWVAPELLMHSIISRSSDVYSFGIIMYELLTFKIPFEDHRKEQVVMGVMNGVRPTVPEEHQLPPGTSSSTCLWSYVRLMEECWQQDPSKRPSFEVVARRLKAMQRWRGIIHRLQPHVHEAVARRAHSMPAGAMHGSYTQVGSQHGDRTTLPADGHAQPDGNSYDEGGQPEEAARRIASAPPTNGTRSSGSGSGPGQPGGRMSMAAALRAQLLQPMGAQLLPLPLPPLAAVTGQGPAWQLPVASIPEGQPDQQQQQDQTLGQQAQQWGKQQQQQWAEQQQRRQQALGGDDVTASVCVSSAVVDGTRLAIIPTGPGMQEEDALTSLVSPECIAEAKRVLLVASDLPSNYGHHAML